MISWLQVPWSIILPFFIIIMLSQSLSTSFILWEASRIVTLFLDLYSWIFAGIWFDYWLILQGESGTVQSKLQSTIRGNFTRNSIQKWRRAWLQSYVYHAPINANKFSQFWGCYDPTAISTIFRWNSWRKPPLKVFGLFYSQKNPISIIFIWE